MVFVFRKCKTQPLPNNMSRHDDFLAQALFLLADLNHKQCAAYLIVMSEDDASFLGSLGFLCGTAFHRARIGSDTRYTTPAAKNRPADDSIAIDPDNACMFCQ